MINPENIFDLFTPVTLKEMDGVKLLDRTESKYVFHASLLHGILEKLADDYRILEIDGLRKSRYETIYFDKDDFLFYRMHHNGKANRYKLRIRRYLDSGLAFYEFKLKNQKKRTVKTRIAGNQKDAVHLAVEPFSLISDKAATVAHDIHPVLNVHYTRITLVSKTAPERLTIDIALKFTVEEVDISYGSICIAEVKQQKNARSSFVDQMHHLHIQPLSDQ